MRWYVHTIWYEIFFSTLTSESKAIYKLFVELYYVFYCGKVDKNEDIGFANFYVS